MSKTFTPSHLENLVAAKFLKGNQKRQEEMDFLGAVQPESYKLIPLLHGMFALVDNEDADVMMKSLWHISANGYAVRFIGRRCVAMHQVIFPCPTGKEIDHVNRNKCDNRKSNLRISNKRENQGNRWKSRHAKTSKYKGVCYHRRDRSFAAYGHRGDKQLRLGTFQNEIDAAKAYNDWATMYFGEFALLNPV